MNPTQIVALVVRLFGVALLFYSIRQLSAMVWVLEMPDAPATQWTYYLSAGLVVLIAVLLWKFPLIIANRIMAPGLTAPEEKNWDTSDLYNCGFVILGFYILFQTISDGTYWGIYSLWANRNPTDHWEIEMDQKAAMVTTIVEFAIAVFLIFGHRILTKFVYRLRYGGIE